MRLFKEYTDYLHFFKSLDDAYYLVKYTKITFIKATMRIFKAKTKPKYFWQ